MTLPLITNLQAELVEASPYGPNLLDAGECFAPPVRAAVLCAPGPYRRWPLSLLLILAMMLSPRHAAAVSCTMQSQIASAERAELSSAVARMAGYAVAGDANGLRAMTLPSVAAQFDGIAATVEGLPATLKGSVTSIETSTCCMPKT